jgi:hypothetical protein
MTTRKKAANVTSFVAVGSGAKENSTIGRSSVFTGSSWEAAIARTYG